MKKYAFVALLAMFTVSVNAQVSYMDDRDAYSAGRNSGSKFRKHLVDNHITTFKIYSYSHKHPEGLLFYQEWIDSRGNMVENMGYTKSGKIRYHFKYQYNDSNQQTALTDYKKNKKISWGQSRNYDKRSNLTEIRSWRKDSAHITYDYITQYDSKNNITQSKTYSSRRKLDAVAIYEYYDDGSKKKTTTYNGKMKLTGVWNYDCNPVGKLQESKMKDTSKICIHYETDKNGNPVKIKEEYTEGGRLFKYRERKITKYDKDNHPIEEIVTTLNGKEISHSSSDFDAQGNWTTYRKYKPGSTTIKKRMVYEYDTSGNITQITAYIKSSATGTVMKYVYN